MEQKNNSLLEIHELSISFNMYESAFEQQTLNVISNLHLSVSAGEIVAVIGSSGSGKSLLASAILGILPPNAELSGHLHFKGRELDAEMLAKLRGNEIALVPQSISYLDTLMKIGQQTDGHKKPYPTKKREELFRRFSLPESTGRIYPYELSGGMARRVLISSALINDAELIIADEPTPGISPEQAEEAMQLFRELADAGKAIILISHDIELAIRFADKVAVFYAGTTVETAPAADFLSGPEALRHPYSRALWRALPQNGFEPIEGLQPYAGIMRNVCPFAPRCPKASGRCFNEFPPVRELRGGEVRCFHAT